MTIPTAITIAVRLDIKTAAYLLRLNPRYKLSTSIRYLAEGMFEEKASSLSPQEAWQIITQSGTGFSKDKAKRDIIRAAKKNASMDDFHRMCDLADQSHTAPYVPMHIESQEALEAELLKTGLSYMETLSKNSRVAIPVVEKTVVATETSSEPTTTDVSAIEGTDETPQMFPPKQNVTKIDDRPHFGPDLLGFRWPEFEYMTQAEYSDYRQVYFNAHFDLQCQEKGIAIDRTQRREEWLVIREAIRASGVREPAPEIPALTAALR